MHSCWWSLLLTACTVLLLQNQPCSADDTFDSTFHDAKAIQEPADVTQQAHAQQLIATVLAAVDTGTVKASSALSLLRDLSSLRHSLLSGAAAARWQQRQGTAAVNGRQQQQQQQQGLRRGILIVAGGSHQLRNAYILINTLLHRDINCTLPIEIVYYGPHEFDTAAADAIQQLGRTAGVAVHFIDGSTVPPSGAVGLDPHKAPGRLTGFKAKVHALVWVTSFDHVIMLDSDNTALSDPTPLLDSEPFKTHGSILWPDFWTNQWMQPALYSLLGLDTPWEMDPGFRACEAGQVVIDRLRHYDVLEYLSLLNSHSNSGFPGADLGVVGQCLWGDKDTYPIAFQLAGKATSCYTVPHMPLQALSKTGARLAHAGMVQRAPWASGPLMWLHRTAAGKFWPHCKLHEGKPCRIWGFTTPVDQQQLLASVKEPSAMEMGLDKVDLEWADRHCADNGGDCETGGSSGSDSSSGSGSSGSSSGGSRVAAAAAGQGTSNTAGGEGASQKGQQCNAVSGVGGGAGMQCEGGMDAVATVVYANSTALPCELDKAVGVLPIPVIRTKQLPAQVKRMLKAAQRAFKASMQI